MILSDIALQKIDQKIKLELAIALGFTEYWVTKLIANNKPNGPLTTATALKVIREETGLEDKEILMEELDQGSIAQIRSIRVDSSTK
jgi:hypothetical protein